MKHRQHSLPHAVLFLVMVFAAAEFLTVGSQMPSLVRCAGASLALTGAALAIIEMADYFMFGKD